MDELDALLRACDNAELYRQDTVIVEIARIRELAKAFEDAIDEARHQAWADGETWALTYGNTY